MFNPQDYKQDPAASQTSQASQGSSDLDKQESFFFFSLMFLLASEQFLNRSFIIFSKMKKY